MCRFLLSFVVAILATLISLPSASALTDTTIHVNGAARASLDDWPLVVNLPVAQGTLQPGQALTLAHGSTRLPTQTKVLAKWEDGSVRWLRLDALADIPSGGSLELHPTRGTPPRPKSQLQIRERAEAIEVDTGAVAFEIPRRRFALAENVRPGVGMSAVFGSVGNSLVADGRVYSATAPTSVRLVDAGPVRATVELKGRLSPDFSYLIRIAVVAGSSLVRVLHTYTKDGGRPESIVERLSVDIPFRKPLLGTFEAGRMGLKPLSGAIAEGTSIELAQTDSGHFRAADVQHDGRLAGWFEGVAKHGAVGIAARYFWQEYPQAVSIGPQGITYDLWSPRSAPARIGMGSAKTHEFVFWVAKRGTIGKSRARLAGRPLRGVVDPVALARSQALPGTFDPTTTTLDEKLVESARRYKKRNAKEKWDDCGRARCGAGAVPTERVGAFGMLNWGDWNFPGYQDTVKGTDAWGNLEYDTTQVLALAYAASGNREVFDQMVAAARHFMDVDTIHALPSRREWVGMNHPKNPRHFTFELGGVDVGHTWIEGLLSYYLLTGDQRGFDVARGIADYLVHRLSDFLRGNPRQWGWPQIALTAMYDLTREERYLAAAQRYAAGGMAAHTVGEAKLPWKLGILADGVSRTHESGGGGKAIERWLQRYANAVVKRGLADARFYPGVAYGGAILNKPAWIAVANEKAQRIKIGNWGKPFTINGRLRLRLEALRQQSAAAVKR